HPPTRLGPRDLAPSVLVRLEVGGPRPALREGIPPECGGRARVEWKFGRRRRRGRGRHARIVEKGWAWGGRKGPSPLQFALTLMRTIWNGSISFGLVNIPIGLALATQRSDVAFRTLHRECGTPIKQKRWCPHHERE